MNKDYEELKKIKGRIHSYESCGTVDGPGLRFVVFTQGCQLRCQYCHNADSWDFNRGQEVTVGEVLAEVVKYKSYMKFSGGGVTITGGEPLCQPEFIEALFICCKREGIHTTVDTSGYVNIKNIEKILDFTDLVLLDLKSMDNDHHKELTGVELDRIKEFALELSKRKQPIWIRHVLVPGLTDNDNDLHALGEFVSKLNNVGCLELLPFHKMGEYKWEELGLDYKLHNTLPPLRSRIENAATILSSYGIDVKD